jgi:dihydrofolate reductase
VRDLIYSMNPSLDGYIADRRGGFEWSVPDEELHRFHNECVGELGGHLLGRRLYETMVYWETADQDPDVSDVALEFAGIWQALPKVVFSTTLREVEGRNIRLATEDLATEVERLKAEPGGDLAVGGAGLAAACAELDAIDEYRLFVNPVIVGGGTPHFPALDRQVDLALVETRTFGSRVVYLRYRRVRTTDVST